MSFSFRSLSFQCPDSYFRKENTREDKTDEGMKTKMETDCVQSQSSPYHKNETPKETQYTSEMRQKRLIITETQRSSRNKR